MAYWGLALVTALIGSLPLDLGRKGWLAKWPIMVVSLTLLNACWAYFGTPQLVGPWLGAGAVWMVIIGFAINLVVRLIMDMTVQEHGWPVGWPTLVGMAVVIVLPMFSSCSGCTAFRSGDYRSFVAEASDQRAWTDDMAPVDPVHIRMVDSRQARRLMGIALGQAEGSLGSRYEIGNLTIQRIRDGLFWVAPLEFTGFKSWQRNDTTPGFLVVDAMNPSAEAQLHIGHQFRYMRSACFGDNLDRHIYTHGYQFTGYGDYTFELDDDMNPFWVITLYRPTIAYWGEEISGVITVNPTTGDIQRYGSRTGDDSNIPAWVDRVVPQDLAFDRLTWFGRYVHGWWNSWWGEVDINVPTQPENMRDMWLVWGDDDRAYWFTGLTSQRSSDNSLVGFALMDSRTGTTRFYRASGADEVDIIRAVRSEVSNYSNYVPTQPILYNIYGQLTWGVPIISEEGVFQRLALAHAQTGQVALGQNKAEALRNYRRLLQEAGNEAAPSSESDTHAVTGTLTRIAADVRGGDTTYYLMIDAECEDEADCATETDSIIFTGTSLLSPELPLAGVGDRVTIGYLETAESTVPMSHFDLLEFDTRSSENQERADEINERLGRTAGEIRDARDARSRISNMSDDEVLEMMRRIREEVQAE